MVMAKKLVVEIIADSDLSLIHISRSVDFGEDRLRERGSLPVTFYVLTRVIFYMTNDNCRKFKQNQLLFCMQP